MILQDNFVLTALSLQKIADEGMVTEMSFRTSF